MPSLPVILSVIKTEEYGSRLYSSPSPVPYLDRNEQLATFSHTFEEDELSYQANGRTPSRALLRHLKSACKLAHEDGIPYMWSDIICASTHDLGRLSGEVNSMYGIYKWAEKCYAYLSDVTRLDELKSSKWFKMGWTLVQLVASREVIFLNKKGEEIARKSTHQSILFSATGIENMVLMNRTSLRNVCVAKRFSWAASRSTVSEVNMAYCLISLFGVSMDLEYNETLEAAFRRLQFKIMERFPDDLSIFAWACQSSGDSNKSQLLARSPSDFANCEQVTIRRYPSYLKVPVWNRRLITSGSDGAHLNLPILLKNNKCNIILNCSLPQAPPHFLCNSLQVIPRREEWEEEWAGQYEYIRFQRSGLEAVSDRTIQQDVTCLVDECIYLRADGVAVPYRP
ncbi:hypothetical protein BDV23DRAFT_178722 [Aspergillus alliaceus]|uniref:Uncharacterized protein n=1 Tax=Petromyces alliaceus TaxID=209559 RepID=A0A5N7CLU1_PETAA|nr:hypothetical protein BDV23DRAFT_178722 [Aspergillus alliaceus]